MMNYQKKGKVCKFIQKKGWFLNFPIYKHLITILFSLNILLTSCAQTKSFQCQKIYTIANNVAKETKALTSNGSSQEIDKKTWLLAADKIEQAAEDMKKINVNDLELQKYKTLFAQVYQDYADATREIIQVLESKDRIAARSAQEKVRKAGQLEREVGSSFDSYCQK